jgi:hypothetical protein
MFLSFATYPNSLGKSSNKPCRFYLISFLLLAIVASQFNYSAINLLNFANAEIELSNESLDNDHLQTSTACQLVTNFYLSYIIHHTTLIDIQLNYFLYPDTRAPPVFS